MTPWLCAWSRGGIMKHMLVSWRPGNNEIGSQDPSVSFKDTLHPPSETLLLSGISASGKASYTALGSVQIQTITFSQALSLSPSVSVFLWLLTQDSICTCHAWMDAVPRPSRLQPSLPAFPSDNWGIPAWNSGFRLRFTYWSCAKLYLGLLATPMVQHEGKGIYYTWPCLLLNLIELSIKTSHLWKVRVQLC